jgi:hypothetical protein
MTRSKESYTIPSSSEIEKAAYDLWERRGYSHGSDREDWLAAERDLTFALNYRPLVHLDLDSGKRVEIGPARPVRCRFCEQAFSLADPPFTLGSIFEFLGVSSVVSSDLCGDCGQSFKEGLEPGLRRFWEGIPDLLHSPEGKAHVKLAVFKGLTWLALAAMPERELEYFPDAIEWACNPEHDEDSGLFSRLSCLVYAVSVPGSAAWAGLEARRDEDALLPSLVFFLAGGGFVVQTAVPLGVRDQELDGEELQLPRRSWSLAGVTNAGPCRLVTPEPLALARGGARRSWLGG